jgi:O-antigen/teichoic acid export membrane protein
MQHVNNSKYLSFLELARMHYFNDVLSDEVDWFKEGIILASASINFKTPILISDKVEVMELLYHEANLYWSEIFGWLITTFVFISIIYVYGSLLTAGEKLKQLNIIAGAGVVLNIGLNFILITNYKALGATYATVITQFLVAAWHVFMVYRIFKFSLKPMQILIPLLFLLLISAAAYGSQFLSSTWLINFLLASLAAPLIAFAIGLLNVKAVMDLVKKGAKV